MKGRLGSWAGLALGPYWKHPGAFLSDRLGLSTSFSLGTKGVGTVKCMWCAPQLVTLPAPLVHPEGHWRGVLLSSEAGRGGSGQSDYAAAWLPLQGEKQSSEGRKTGRRRRRRTAQGREPNPWRGDELCPVFDPCDTKHHPESPSILSPRYPLQGPLIVLEGHRL